MKLNVSLRNIEAWSSRDYWQGHSASFGFLCTGLFRLPWRFVLRIVLYLDHSKVFEKGKEVQSLLTVNDQAR